MSHETLTVDNKSKWGPGPWQDEPDKVNWRTEAGLPGMIVRGPMGSLCGYVAVPPGHPAHGKAYNDVYDKLGGVSVHGGLTYAAACRGNICHEPEAGESESVWWFGFDCAHFGDLSPQFGREFGFGDDVYRDVSYVTAEVESLARQLVAIVGVAS